MNLSFLFLNLFRYLQEIGFTDKVLDVRSARVRSLLGATTDELTSETYENGISRDRKKSESRHHVASVTEQDHRL